MATSTMPNGAKLVNVVTIFSKKATSAAGSSRFWTSRPLPVRGSISPNETIDSRADSTQTDSIKKKNKIAGSGNLLPAFSMTSKKRVVMDFFRAWSFVLIRFIIYAKRAPGGLQGHRNANRTNRSAGKGVLV